MGMFDYIRCEYSLPGTPPEFIRQGHEFQTKDLDCTMDTYTISADGTLDAEGYGPGYTGTLSFGASNVCAAGPGVYTRNGEDAESVEYEATFVDGKLAKFIESHRRRRPALKYVPPVYVPPTEEEERQRKARRDASRLGQRLYVLWGGQEYGYWGDVVAESDRQWCIRIVEVEGDCFHSVGELQTIDRFGLDTTIFETKEEAVRDRLEREAEWEAGKREYEELVRSRDASTAT